MISEGLMRPGSAKIRFVDDVPSSIVRTIFAAIDEDAGGPGAHIVITPGHIDCNAVSDADLLAKALWRGRIMRRNSRTELECLGLSSWLDTYNDAEISFDAAAISAQLSALLVNDLTAGTVVSTGTTAVTRTFDIGRQTHRQMLDTAAALGGWEYHVNPNLTVDAGTTANVFRTVASEATPLVVLSRVGGANDWIYRALRSEIDEPVIDVGDISTKVVVIGQDGYLGIDTAAVSLKAPGGSTPTLVTTKVAASELAANADILAGLVLGERTARWRATARTTSPLARRHARPGDSIYVYDPLAEVVDGTQQITLRGETISPILTRVIGVLWGTRRGMGVYLRTNAGVYTDLSQWVVDEGPETTWTVGDADTPSLAGRVGDDATDIITSPGPDPDPGDGGGGTVGFDCEVPSALIAAPYTDASLLIFVPKACEGNVIEAVSGLIATKGPAFGQWIEEGDNIAIQSGAAGVVASGNAPALEYYGDATIGVRVSIGRDDQDVRLMSIAGLRIDCVGSGSDGWFPKLSATNLLGDEITITSATELALDTAYEIFATYEASTGNVELFVDESSVGSDAVDNPGNRASQGDFWYIGVPDDSWITNCATWGEVLDIGASDYVTDLLFQYTTDVDADPVGTWYDDTANAIDLGQGTAGSKPVLSGGFVSFDGSNDFMTATGFQWNKAAWTLFIRTNWAGLSSSFDILARIRGNSSNGAMAAYFGGSNTFELHAMPGANPAAGAVKIYNSTGWSGSLMTLTMRFDGTNAGLILRRNGTEVTPSSNPFTSPSSNTGAVASNSVFGAESNGSNAGQFIIPHIRCYDAVLTDDQCAIVESAMSA